MVNLCIRSSGIQILPKMQQRARHVTTFIREPAWISPTQGMEYHRYSDEEKEQFRKDPNILLQMRKKTESAMAAIFPLLIQNSASQKATITYMKSQMTQKINNEELSKKLIPNFAVGCRRLTVGVGTTSREPD